MGIENSGNIEGGRGHQGHGIFPVLVGLHGKSFGPERITAAVFSVVDVKGEEMKPGQRLAVFVEQGGAKSNVRMGRDRGSHRIDWFSGPGMKWPQGTHQQKNRKRNHMQVSGLFHRESPSWPRKRPKCTPISPVRDISKPCQITTVSSVVARIGMPSAAPSAGEVEFSPSLSISRMTTYIKLRTLGFAVFETWERALRLCLAD